MSATPSRNKPFLQLIRRSQLALAEGRSRREEKHSSIPTSAEISQAALARDLDSLWNSEPELRYLRSPLMEELQMRLAQNWQKYFVVGLLYGLAVYGFFSLTS
jgi:hypothetical protein